MGFLKNAWYVAMWAENLKEGEPRGITILDQAIVVFRTAGGGVAALEDRCPHRSAPLHLGSVCADGTIECGYHGLRFDGSGSCVLNPHGKGIIPAGARVRPYPVCEKHTLIWVWLGDRPADPAEIPDLSALDTSPQEHVTLRDRLEMDVHYQLVVDNLLDLSHTAYLHKGVLGNPQTTAAAEIAVQQSGNTVTVSRWMPAVPPPGLHDLMFHRDGALVDHWAAMTWHAPSVLVNDAGVTRPGAGQAEGTTLLGFHLLTPVSRRKTIYHFAAVRMNPVPFPEPLRLEIMEQLSRLRRQAFTTEDEPMIEAQQRAIDHVGEENVTPVLLEVDGGAVRYRRVLERLLKDEAACAS